MRYRPGDVAELLGVSADTVRRWCDDGRLAASRSSSGGREIDGVDLAAFLKSDIAQDAPGWALKQSARNRLLGIVTEIVRDRVVATVELQVGPHRLVSLVTAEAIDDLGLEVGSTVVAAVKSTNVVLEVP